MTYVSKREKVFDLPEQEETSSTSLNKSETLLKSFPSGGCDRRAWAPEECHRYQQSGGPASGSELSVSKSSGFKYIPFDVLLAILMAEKDAYIQELLERQQDDSRSCCGGKLYKAEGFEDSDDDREALIRKDAEVVALKNKIGGLESELEDCRDTLTKAMHKLETMDAILSENNLLREKMKYSEETIKCLEKKKAALEKEVECLREAAAAAAEERKESEAAPGRNRHLDGRHFWDGGDCEEILPLSSERDVLLHQVEELQKELERAKMTAAEMEVLRKISETTSSSLEEISKENECYKKKLESMKGLEKHLQELKKQAHALTDKYKRECEKANIQMKQIKVSTREVEALTKERNKLKERVQQLTNYESQYLSLQGKLQQVELILDENETLNNKLVQLDRLEAENEELKVKIKELQSAEVQVAEDKERIKELQSAVVEQEEEIRRMLGQIKDLSQGYIDKNEIHRMQNELEEKNGKLKKYEKQLTEIPVLESEIDELRNKLQKCIDDFKSDKELLKKLQEELEACRKRCHELEEMAPACSPPKPEPPFHPAVDLNKNEQIHKTETVSVEKEMKNTTKQDATGREVQEKCVQTQMVEGENVQELRRRLTCLEEELNCLKQTNALLDKEMDACQAALRLERKAREFALAMAEEMEEKAEQEKARRQLGEAVTKLRKEEANVAKQQMYLDISREMDNLKISRHLWKDLVKELKNENEILRKMKEYSEDVEKKGLKGLIKKLKSEVAVLKSLSKPTIEGEVEALQVKVKKLVKETDGLVEEMSSLKSALDSERKAKEDLEEEVRNLQEELSTCLAASGEVLKREMAAKDAAIADLRKDVADARNEVENCANEAQDLRDENVRLFNSYNNLKSQQKNLESEINALLSSVETLKEMIRSQEEREKEQDEELNACQDTINVYRADLERSKTSVEGLEGNVRELEEALRSKEDEVGRLAREAAEVQSELFKVKSEMEVLKCRLEEKENAIVSEVNYEESLEEKYELEEALRKIENELEELKVKMEECRQMEEEMILLRSKKDVLLEKMSAFQEEIELLKRKLLNFETLKSELDQLKAEKQCFGPEERKDLPTDVTELCRLLQQKTAEVEVLKRDKETLKEELAKTENLMDVWKELQKTIPPPHEAEFFTPPALPASPNAFSPRRQPSDFVPADVHRKEITDLKSSHEATVLTLKKANADKIRKLLAQHEKEADLRRKAFNGNVNSIKSGYVNDIRKLVEKHKNSIVRLQLFHEEEVQELNKNHETQMEAMQTQNENVINDLKTETLQKWKQMEEEHGLELEELRQKCEALLKEKEARVLAEESNVECGWVETADDIREADKEALESLTQFYQKNIMELEEKHAKEIKKCKKSHMKRIDLMKNKYEALLNEERKKYKEQLEEMLLPLKKGEKGDASEREVGYFPGEQICPSSSSLEFLQVLQKIINEGLETLSFDELILVHGKTCFAPGRTERNKNGSSGEQVVGTGCKHRALMTAEKEELLKRIFILEHEIVVKQLETHEAIVNMEAAERCKVQELKNALTKAQEKNAELKRHVSDQSKLQMDLKIERYMLDKQASLHETSVMQKVKELESEKAGKRRLEEELQKERTNVKHLAATLEAEKERFRSQTKRDADYIESIRSRLEEALSHEQMMEAQLDYEARFRAKLESELQALQKSFNLMADFPAGQLPVASKTAKDLRNLDQCETIKGEFRNRSKSRSKAKALSHS